MRYFIVHMHRLLEPDEARHGQQIDRLRDEVVTRRIVRSRAFHVAVGLAAAWWLRIVWMTNRATVMPPDVYDRIGPHLPAIITMWHGQHFLMPFVRLKSHANHKTKVLISRHYDGEFNAIAAEHLGIGTIRGSGDTGGRFDLKGGVGAFKAMLDTLKDGWNVALTADVPKIGRRRRRRRDQTRSKLGPADLSLWPSPPAAAT